MVKSLPLDRTFSALSDPTRRDILERLALGPATISQLADPAGMSLPGLMKHVRILENAARHDGEARASRQCRLGPEHLDDAALWIESHRRRWDGRLDRLEAYIHDQEGGRT